MPIKCELCGKALGQIAPNHLRFKHNGMTVAEYQKMFPEAPIKSPEVIRKQKQSARKILDDPEYRQGMRERAKKLWEDPKYCLRQSKASKKMWENPEYRARQVEIHAQPEFQQSLSDTTTTLWNDPEYRNRALSGIRRAHADPNYRRLRSILTKEQFSSPEARAKASKQAIKRWEDPEYRRKQSESRKGMTPWNKGIPCSQACRQKIGAKQKEYLKTHKHPRGMLGKHHTEEVRQQISKASKARWEDNEWAEQMLRKMRQGLHKGPTQPELALAVLLKENGYGGYEYTGDRSLWLDRRNPDFVWHEGHKIIEMFGVYWHDESEIEPRTKHFAEHGYQTLIIWDYELKDTEQLLAKLKGFHQD